MIREDRYIVIKRKDLFKGLADEQISDDDYDSLWKILQVLPHREYVVVESDWPEYEKVWEMIEERVDGGS